MAVEWDFIDNKKQCLWIYDSIIQNWKSLDVGLPIYDPSAATPFLPPTALLVPLGMPCVFTV
ncbi:hypothetical protein AMTR_s00463p00014090 [Amborella trichopoda]|uniref:Uncharacterized protein n=1 Tax=Amborella trichopoda TaxID=13333 RepID=W1P5I6_AMBTC|nr:hypothetical protein AMTR_s00463p00014090 [Amborella trichopoda]